MFGRGLLVQTGGEGGGYSPFEGSLCGARRVMSLCVRVFESVRVICFDSPKGVFEGAWRGREVAIIIRGQSDAATRK